MRLFRVLFQFIDDQGHPRFEFTTALADDQAEAEATIAGLHSGDFGFSIVQTVEANDAPTGFTAEQEAAAVAHYAATAAEHPHIERNDA